VFDNERTNGFLLHILECLIDKTERLLTLAVRTNQTADELLLPLEPTLVVEVLH
jgi:hypothetical protein